MSNMTNRLKWLIVPLAAMALDLSSKAWVLKTLKPGEQIEVIKSFFYLKLSFNSGAIFGLMQDASPKIRIPLLLVAGLGALCYFGWEFLKEGASKTQRVALGLILGGALGNGTDRLMRGHVVDFLDFWFGSWEYWIFNLADSLIISGAILYGLAIYAEYRKKETSCA
jgi:signal peptidase II